MTEPESKPSSESLAAIIVGYRSLGLFKDKAREAMAELARRETEGDDFEYEAWIDAKLKEIPQSDINPEVLKIVSSIASTGSLEGFEK